MTKRLLVTLLALCLGFGTTALTGCTSGGSKDESDVAESNDQRFAEEGEGDFADNPDNGGGGGDQAAPSDQAANPDAAAMPEDSGDDLKLGDEPGQKDELAQQQPAAGNPEDDLSLDNPEGQQPQAEAPPAAENPPPAVAEEPPPPTDEPVFDEPKDKKQDVAASEAPPPPPAEEPAPAPAAPVDTYSAPKAPAVYSPMLKIKSAAFTAADGTTLNRVYLARPKDNLKSISTKLYGNADRQKDLKKWNPVLKSRGPRTGDKIYYASATNPSDGRMLTFYEEQNIPPQQYTSQPGDNIRKVSKNLLGFNDAWKEVWATNLGVESKGNLPAGTTLNYWPETSAPTQTVAKNNVAPPTEPPLPDTAPAAPPVPPPDMNAPPTTGTTGQPPQQAANPPPPIDNPGADPLAPPPPMPDEPAATGTMGKPNPQQAANPPQPEPPTAVPQPDAPKPVKKAPPPPEAASEGGMDADTTMIIGLGGILLIAAAILFVVIRKNRAKRMDLGQTQV